MCETDAHWAMSTSAVLIDVDDISGADCFMLLVVIRVMVGGVGGVGAMVERGRGWGWGAVGRCEVERNGAGQDRAQRGGRCNGVG